MTNSFKPNITREVKKYKDGEAIDLQPYSSQIVISKATATAVGGKSSLKIELDTGKCIVGTGAASAAVNYTESTMSALGIVAGDSMSFSGVLNAAAGEEGIITIDGTSALPQSGSRLNIYQDEHINTLWNMGITGTSTKAIHTGVLFKQAVSAVNVKGHYDNVRRNVGNVPFPIYKATRLAGGERVELFGTFPNNIADADGKPLEYNEVTLTASSGILDLPTSNIKRGSKSNSFEIESVKVTTGDGTATTYSITVLDPNKYISDYAITDITESKTPVPVQGRLENVVPHSLTAFNSDVYNWPSLLLPPAFFADGTEYTVTTFVCTDPDHM